MDFDITYDDLNKFLKVARIKLKVTYLKNSILGVTYRPCFLLPKIMMVVQLIKYGDNMVLLEYRCSKGAWIISLANSLNLLPKGVTINTERMVIKVLVDDMNFNDNLKRSLLIESLVVGVNGIQLSTRFGSIRQTH